MNHLDRIFVPTFFRNYLEIDISFAENNKLFVNIASNIVQIFHKRLSNQISYTFFLFFFSPPPPKNNKIFDARYN